MKGWALWHGQYFLYIKQLVGLAQDQYPERLANVYVHTRPGQAVCSILHSTSSFSLLLVVSLLFLVSLVLI